MNCRWCYKSLKLSSKHKNRYICLNEDCGRDTVLSVDNNELCDYRSYHYYLNKFIIYLTGDLKCNKTYLVKDNNILIEVPFIKLSFKNYGKESEDLIKRLMKLQAFT